MPNSPYGSPNRRFDVVFCDVDGCISPEPSGPADVPALARLAENNARAVRDRDRPVIVPCTGRPQPFCEAVCKILGHLDGLPAICEHGGWLYWFERHHWVREPTVTRHDLDVVHAMEAWVREELEPQGCYLELGKHLSVTVLHEDMGFLLAEVRPRVEAKIAAEAWPLRVGTTWTCINATLTHVSKATGIRRAIEACGLDPARTAGIGDTMGDLAIREAVAWFGCPANAEAELKPHADAVSSSDITHGVIELLGMMSE